MFCGSCEAPGQEPEVCNEQPSGFGGRRPFEVLGETAASAKPGEGSLDDPTPRQKLEAFDALWSLDDLNRPWSAMGECRYELFAAVNSIGKDMEQLGKPAPQLLQQWNGPVAILNVGGMNLDGEQEAIGVGDNMPFAAVDTLTGIVASRTTGLSRRCTLAVDDRHRRPGLAPQLPASLPNQSCDDFLPSSGIAPSVKIALDRRVRRKLLRQGTPLAASGQNVKNRLQNLAQIHFSWSTQSTSTRKPPCDQRPLRVGHIACVPQVTALILGTSDFSPWHDALPRIFANPKESRPAGITHCFFGQALTKSLSRIVMDARIKSGHDECRYVLTNLYFKQRLSLRHALAI